MKNDHFKTKAAAMPDRRAELLDEVADYILRNGLADLSLRPLATAINTSPRMLLYFFETKEQLIADALAHIRTREQLDFKRAVSKSRPVDRMESLLRDWRLSASPRREKYSRLFFEVYGLALQNRKQFPGFLERAVGDWLPLFEQAFAAVGGSPACANPGYARVGCSTWAAFGPAGHGRTKAYRGSFSGNAKIVLLGGAIAPEVERSEALQR